MFKPQTGQNYRTIIDLKKIEFCRMINIIKKNGKSGIYVLDLGFNFFNDTLGGVILPCPYEVWDFFKINYVNSLSLS